MDRLSRSGITNWHQLPRSDINMGSVAMFRHKYGIGYDIPYRASSGGYSQTSSRRSVIVRIQGPRTSGMNPERGGSSFLGFQACIEMVNTRFNSVRPVAPVNSPAEESVARGHGRGKGR
uniref:'chromo' domain containing protein n=1 Tax=Solanum tuberosum TaxID=4113 RepID=M1DTT5_SOLTU